MQFNLLSKKTKKILKEKIRLTLSNPGRNKKIKGVEFNFFRIRFKEKRKEKRALYYIKGEKIKFKRIIDRKKNYKELKTNNRN